MMMRGSTSGARMTASSSPRAGTRWRTSTNAAAVPSSVAETPVSTAVINDRTVAATQSGELKNKSYQRSEKPLGGNSMNVPLVNDTGMTNSDGSTRNAITQPQTVPSTALPTARPGRDGSDRAARSQIAPAASHSVPSAPVIQAPTRAEARAIGPGRLAVRSDAAPPDRLESPTSRSYSTKITVDAASSSTASALAKRQSITSWMIEMITCEIIVC